MTSSLALCAILYVITSSVSLRCLPGFVEYNGGAGIEGILSSYAAGARGFGFLPNIRHARMMSTTTMPM